MSRISDRRPIQVREALLRTSAELFCGGGIAAEDGTGNGYQAEAEILRESVGTPLRSIVVNVQGVVYTGEYECSSADGYTPGEWKLGEQIPVRLAGDKLFLRRRNGCELQTDVVRRLG